MNHYQTLRPIVGGGDCPTLEAGIRPDTMTPLNTFAVLKNGATVFIAPSPVKRPSWRSNPRQVAKAQAMVNSRDIVERVSREQDLAIEIERAIATGSGIDGFLRIDLTVTGAVRALPVKGKCVIYRDVVTMARAIDREQCDVDALAALGLSLLGLVAPAAPTRSLVQAAPAPKAKKVKEWVTLSGGFAGLKG